MDFSDAAIAARLNAFKQNVARLPLLAAMATLRPDVYLVGGSVRDLLLGQTSHDHDFVVSDGAFELARQVADACGGSFVPLKAARGMARVVWRGEQADVADFQLSLAQRQAGAGLEADLTGRDLTINAMAIDLNALLRSEGAGVRTALRDPARGLDDLRRAVLRCPSPRVIADDPLRALRVARFACRLGYAVESSTVDAIRSQASRLGEVAGERVRDELLNILATARAADGIESLAQWGVLPVILAESDGSVGPLRNLDTATASLDEVTAAAVAAHLAREIRHGVTRRQICRLGTLLRVDPDGDGVAALSARLRLSNAEERLLRSMLAGHSQLAAGLTLERFSRMRRFFASVGDGAVEACLLSRARGLDGTPQALLRWYAGGGLERSRPLLDGHAVARALGVGAGKTIGAVLESLADAQADGEVSNPDEAVAWIRKTGHLPTQDRSVPS